VHLIGYRRFITDPIPLLVAISPGWDQ
jgi:hypothetical protein